MGGYQNALNQQTAASKVQTTPVTLVATQTLAVEAGMYLLAKTVAGVITITLADPVSGADDGKEVIFVNNQTQVNVLSGSFLSVGVAKTTATFTAGLVGEFIRLKASAGKWLVLDIVTTGGATMS